MRSPRRTLALGSLMVIAVIGVATDPGMRSEPSSSALAVEPTGGAPAPTLAPVEARASGRSAAPLPEAGAPPAVSPEGRRRAELLAKLAEDLSDPALAVQMLLDELSEAELRTALSELTNLDARDLAEIRDVRDYSQRLAAIAMRGVVLRPEQESEPVPEVVFSRSVDEIGAPLEVAEQFDGAPGDRIYANFSTESYAGDRVLVKWFREGEPQSLLEELLGRSRMLVFGRYPVNRGDEISYVWLSRQGEWEPGRYRVELYDPSGPLRKLATGRFEIAKQPRPRPAQRG